MIRTCLDRWLGSIEPELVQELCQVGGLGVPVRHQVSRELQTSAQHQFRWRGAEVGLVRGVPSKQHEWQHVHPQMLLLVAHCNQGRLETSLDVPVGSQEVSEASGVKRWHVADDGAQGFMDLGPHIGNERCAVVADCAVGQPEGLDPGAQKSLRTGVGCGLRHWHSVDPPGSSTQNCQ